MASASGARRLLPLLAAWSGALALDAAGGVPEVSAMASWLRSIEFDVPESVFWPAALNLGDVPAESGKCSNLTIGRIQATAKTTEDVPWVDYRITGLGLDCVLPVKTIGMTTMEMAFSFVDSVLELSLRVVPVPMHNAEYVLPLGPVDVPQCDIHLNLTSLEFMGDSPMAGLMENARKNIENTVQSGTASDFACTVLKQVISYRASTELSQLASTVMPLLDLAASAHEVNATLPEGHAEDWAAYPPFQVLSKLLLERKDVLSRVLSVAPPIRLPIGRTFNSTDPPIWSSAFPDLARPKAAMADDPVKARLYLGEAVVHGLQSIIGERVSVTGSGQSMASSAALEGFRVDFGGLLEVTVQAPLGTAPQPLREVVQLTLHLKDVVLGMSASAEISRPALDGYFVDQMQMPSCLAGAAGGTGGNPGRVVLLDLSGAATPGVGIVAAGSLERDVTEALETTVQAWLPVFTSSVRALMNGVLRASVPKVNTIIGEILAGLPPCAPTGIYQGPGGAAETALLVVAGGLLLLTAALTARECLRGRWGKKKKEKKEGYQNSSRAFLRAGDPSDWSPEKAGRRRSASSDSSDPGSPESAGFPGLEDSLRGRDNLAGHRVVPRLAAVAYPIVTCATMVLFVYADLCIATIIDFDFAFGGETFSLSPALAFSVLIIATDAWGAGAYCIAGCIIVLSICWPFVKLGLLLYAWYVPTEDLRPEARGKLLSFLDEYGKWSLIDTWLGILALACYRLSWQSTTSDAAFLVNPIPRLPFFVFVIAQVLSLILGHVASGFHRQAVEEDDEVRHDDGGAYVSMPLYTFLPFGTAYRLIASLLATAVMLLLCVKINTFEMIESGVLSILLNEPGDSVTQHSLLELGQGITYGREGDVGLIMVQAIFFVFAVIIPLALLVALSALLLLPWRLGMQKFMMDLCRALDAWAAFDVFALAVFISRFEFGLFSKFLMNHNNIELGCAVVRTYLQQECFHMECRFTPGFAVLAGAAVATYALPKYALKVCAEAMEDAREAKGGDVSPGMSHVIRVTLA